jgi:hypothetical protein
MKSSIHVAAQGSKIRAPHKKLHKIQKDEAKLDTHYFFLPLNGKFLSRAGSFNNQKRF